MAANMVASPAKKLERTIVSPQRFDGSRREVVTTNQSHLSEAKGPMKSESLQEADVEKPSLAKLFKKDYIHEIDTHFSQNESPILDIITWHIFRVTY